MAIEMADRPAAQPLYDVRCRVCGHLLFRARGLARVEIVCPSRSCRRYQALLIGRRPIAPR